MVRRFEFLNITRGYPRYTYTMPPSTKSCPSPLHLGNVTDEDEKEDDPTQNGEGSGNNSLRETLCMLKYLG